jgi:sugar O-acyltransferase (sialic acid O-acetyltransferase NeuD family)
MSGEPRDIVFWGATGQARVLREYIGPLGFRLVALFDDTPDLRSPFPNVPLHCGRDGFEAWLAGIADPGQIACLVAIGGEHGVPRMRIQGYLVDKGLEAIVAVHPTAYVARGTHLGAGSQVLAHAVVAVDAQLGRACIVNTAATIDHEARIGDGVHIAGGAHLAGIVTIDDFAMVGTGASVLPRIRIGEGAVVGAGAVVIRDVEPWSVVAGNPAGVVGRREPKRV